MNCANKRKLCIVHDVHFTKANVDMMRNYVSMFQNIKRSNSCGQDSTTCKINVDRKKLKS